MMNNVYYDYYADQKATDDNPTRHHNRRHGVNDVENLGEWN